MVKVGSIEYTPTKFWLAQACNMEACFNSLQYYFTLY